MSNLQSSAIGQLLEPLYTSLEDGDIKPFFNCLREVTQSSIVCSIDVDFSLPGGRLNNIVGDPTEEEVTEVEKLYEENYAAENSIVAAAAPHIEPGAILRISDHACFDELRDTDFYINFMRPVGMDYTTGVVVECSARHVLGLSLSKDVGGRDYRDADLALLQELLPHVQRVTRLMGYVEGSPRWDVLEAAGIAVVQVDTDLVPRRMTDRMADVLSKGRLFERKARRLVGANVSIQRVLQNLRSRAFGFYIPGQAAPEECVLDLDGHCWSVTALNASPANPLHFPSAELLILVREISPSIFAEEFLGRRYDLTAAESACALALAEAGSVPALARQLNISTNTVRAHLRAIFAKTGTGRQAELVALLAREKLLS